MISDGVYGNNQLSGGDGHHFAGGGHYSGDDGKPWN